MLLFKKKNPPSLLIFGWHFHSCETGQTGKVSDLESGNHSELSENQESKLKSKTRGLFVILGKYISVIKPGNHSKIKVETSKQTNVDEGTISQGLNRVHVAWRNKKEGIDDGSDA